MNDKIFRHTKKSKISEYNLEEIRGWVINQMVEIEKKIDSIICDFFNPEKKTEFNQILLNSSIISIGGKMKILRNISVFDKKIIEKINKLSSIRNAFAHLKINDTAEIIVKVNENLKLESAIMTSFKSELEIMNSTGEIKVKNIQTLISEYHDLDKEIRTYLSLF